MNGSKAVLWDMDGTLVDSEELHWISWRNTMANEGIIITREQFLSTFGQRNDSIIPAWLGSAATAERIERIAEAKEELYRHLVRQVGIAHEPGVATWLHRLREHGWQQAIASAAPRANIDAVLEALSVNHIFQGIVSAEDVRQGQTRSGGVPASCFPSRRSCREVYCRGRRRRRNRGGAPRRHAEHRGKSQR